MDIYIDTGWTSSAHLSIRATSEDKQIWQRKDSERRAFYRFLTWYEGLLRSIHVPSHLASSGDVELKMKTRKVPWDTSHMIRGCLACAALGLGLAWSGASHDQLNLYQSSQPPPDFLFPFFLHASPS